MKKNLSECQDEIKRFNSRLIAKNYKIEEKEDL
jgi:hypothetical protein